MQPKVYWNLCANDQKSFLKITVFFDDVLFIKLLSLGYFYSLIWTKVSRYFGRTKKVHENEIISHLLTMESKLIKAFSI